MSEAIQRPDESDEVEILHKRCAFCGSIIQLTPKGWVKQHPNPMDPKQHCKEKGLYDQAADLLHRKQGQTQQETVAGEME